MEDKIEVNDYVRTKDGYIIRVDENTNIFNLGYKEQYVDMKTTRYGFTCEEEIVKHSKQPIDLINKDDYVNGYKVIKLKDGFADGTMEIVLSNNTIIYRHHSEDIKTILTKESYMANCYKVGGEKE